MNTRTAILLVLLLAAGPALAGGDALPTAESAATANNAFAADLLQRLGKREGNLFFSPYSISVALAMTRAGAKANTAAEMDAVLHTEEVPSLSHRELATALLPPLVRDGWGDDAKELPAYELTIANAVWAQEELAIEPSFGKVLEGSFGAGLERIDFRDQAAARKIINDWVAEKTKEKIRDIVPEDLPTPDTLMALANAIYMKAAWKYPFDEDRTKDAPFTTAAGTEVKVPMMAKAEGFRYAEADGMRIADLPYRNGIASMTILLPKAKDGLAAALAKLTPKRLDAWLGALRHARLDVRLPKFEISWFRDLGPDLAAMGMHDAFTPRRADFTGITRETPLFIGPVLHKAWIGVDEAGTEAAAATVVMMLKGGAPGRPVPFVVDHPFLFLIRHAKTGAILFAGRVDDPTAE